MEKEYCILEIELLRAEFLIEECEAEWAREIEADVMGVIKIISGIGNKTFK